MIKVKEGKEVSYNKNEKPEIAKGGFDQNENPEVNPEAIA